MCNYVAYNRFYKLRFLHLYLLFFITIYAEIKCLQHSVTYHHRVTVKTFFINVIIRLLQFYSSQNSRTTRYTDSVYFISEFILNAHH